MHHRRVPDEGSGADGGHERQDTRDLPQAAVGKSDRGATTDVWPCILGAVGCITGVFRARAVAAATKHLDT